MIPAAVVGLLSGLAVIALSALAASEYDVALAARFLDAPAALITLGGTVAAVYAAFPPSTVFEGFKSLACIFEIPDKSAGEAVWRIVRLAEAAARDGVLAMEELAADTGDPFLRKGLMLAADGAPPETIRSAMETELEYLNERRAGAIAVWEFIAQAAPAWGVIGALTGLVAALRFPDGAGAAWAVRAAPAAALYGVAAAYLLAKPAAARLRLAARREALVRGMEIDGVLAIRAGEGPRAIRERLENAAGP